MHPSDYMKLLTENVTKSYKHAQEHIAKNIVKEFKDIVDELKLSNHTDPMAETTAFLTLKDHKPDFENHTKCHLINPAKSDVGKIGKSILDTDNSKIREQTGINQWHNSSDTIAWFQSIPLKNRKSSYPLTSRIFTRQSQSLCLTNPSNGQHNSPLLRTATYI